MFSEMIDQMEPKNKWKKFGHLKTFQVQPDIVGYHTPLWRKVRGIGKGKVQQQKMKHVSVRADPRPPTPPRN